RTGREAEDAQPGRGALGQLARAIRALHSRRPGEVGEAHAGARHHARVSAGESALPHAVRRVPTSRGQPQPTRQSERGWQSPWSARAIVILMKPQKLISAGFAI